ncbi:MAG: hemin-degrading factor [Candidatus Binatia bacterium]|nr:hemin-degrading factor [Candidatus Binatia bacterium]
MRDEQQVVVSSQLSSPLEELLYALLTCEEVNLVVRNGRATAEIRGAASLRVSDAWLTITMRGRADHLHVQRGALAQAEFLVTSGRNKAVRFFSDDGQVVLTCYLPGTGEGRPDFSPTRQAAFAQLEASSRGAPWRRNMEITS